MTVASIRDAISAGNHAKAAELFAEYAPSIPESESGLRELRELLDWTRATIVCQRAQALAKLQSARDDAHVLAAYRQ
jgi:hypothetical protein